jgi:hypothetical protein
MSTVQEIESAVARLSADELARFRAWFVDFDAGAWDRHIEEDAHSGRLEAFYQALEHENEGQPDIPLDEVFGKEELP